jgi:mycothiol S-conjugate amidase
VVLTDRGILTVHAHPDDESSKGPATIARYGAEGVRTTLVCCTDGAEGEILNPAVVLGAGETLEERRAVELAAACEVIGYDEVVFLGYRDSGMPDSEANARPEAFANADLAEAVGRLVEVVRRTKPQVMISYPEEQHEYPHPDHLRAHDITVAAFEAACDPARFPDAGEAHEVAKLYYTVWPALRMRKLHDTYLDLGLDSPYDEAFLERIATGERFTTTIDISNFAAVRDDALRCHATQIDPTSPWWFGLPEDVRHAVHPFEHFRLARSRVGSIDVVEDDLFAGL